MKITKWIISIILIIVGICIILYPEVSNSLSKRNQAEIIKKYREDISNIDNGRQAAGIVAMLVMHLVLNINQKS